MVLAVIGRELRVSARHSFTYQLRVLGVASMLVALIAFGAHHGFAANLGGRLFGSLHFALFCAIWVLVPLLTADCISRERREGTLGLLFLTRLTGPSVVVAKSLAQALRAVTLWLAVLPVALVPVLQGGVSWDEALLSILINFSAVCWALMAGLLASAWTRRWSRSLVAAAILSLAFLMLLAGAIGWVWTAVMNPGWLYGWESRLSYAFAMGFALLTDSGGAGHWVDWLRLITPSRLLWALGQVSVASLLFLCIAVLAAGAKLRLSWQDHPASRRQLWLNQVFFTPMFWVPALRRWMRSALDRNPVGWLEKRTWSGRLVTWGWLAVVISLYSGVLSDRRFFGAYSLIHRVLAWLLAASMAVSAAGSFRRERENGVLELLLVSPLKEGKIISGRVRGIWGQFLPAFGLLTALWIYFATLLPGDDDVSWICLYIIVFFCLPLIGLYFSLRCRGFLPALVMALAIGLFIPVFLPALVMSLVTGMPVEGPMAYHGAFLELMITYVCWLALRGRLRKRQFPLQRTER